MQISTSTSLTPDRYVATGSEPVFEIATDGVTLDLTGCFIDGSDYTGVGIHIHDCDGVTIRGGVIRNFYQGIRAENVRNLRIEDCVVSDNHNPQGIGWLPDTHQPNEEGYGGGIFLSNASDSTMHRCLVTGNFNGIDLVRCKRVTVSETDASHCSNVGIHLLSSTHCTVEKCRAEHCIRFTDRFWNDTADSAGILIEEFSHHNRIVDNSLRYSGDGLFIRANNRHSSDNNYIARNDGSHSPNNAFEAVFSSGNVFEDNTADGSNYGFWLGYSKQTIVRGNRICSNRLDGIAIEHGSDNLIEQNVISANRNGIRLWWAPSDLGDDPSSGYVIRENRISGSRDHAVSITNTTDVTLTSNDLHDNRAGTSRKWHHLRQEQ
ncbi:MAG: right-handed parallel beta-helix repeat-containing protein [Dehalococcoidia bacterium]|nr:right-handed parallel beta-helix repeat-containing protein [Dehalococcoidia bacterium]